MSLPGTCVSGRLFLKRLFLPAWKKSASCARIDEYWTGKDSGRNEIKSIDSMRKEDW